MREHDKFMLRLPDGMRDELKAESERNGRSMNSEIVARLEQTLLLPPIEISDDLAERIRNSPAEFRTNRSRMLIEALEEWYPAPPTPHQRLTAWESWEFTREMVLKDQELRTPTYLWAFYYTLERLVKQGHLGQEGIYRVKDDIQELLAGDKK